MTTKTNKSDPAADVEGPDAEQRYLAARAVASLATDAGDCASLLDALGLTARDGIGVGQQHQVDHSGR